MPTQWVSLITWFDEQGNYLFEQGGVYQHGPQHRAFAAAREFRVREDTVTCPGCGQRFADTDDGDAHTHLDMHIHGDDVPSICGAQPIGDLR